MQPRSDSLQQEVEGTEGFIILSNLLKIGINAHVQLQGVSGRVRLGFGARPVLIITTYEKKHSFTRNNGLQLWTCKASDRVPEGFGHCQCA